MNKTEADAIRAKGRHTGYGYKGPIRVKYTDRFQYYVNHIEVSKEYAEWFVTHFQQV